MKTLLEALAERPLLGDGAMGTRLQQAGLEPGGCGEAWNLEHPERVEKIQRSYVEAGSDLLLTNTFGGSRIMLERHGLGDRTAEINRAAVDVARRAFGSRPGFVLGDIGPFGGLMEPFGDIPVKTVRSAFREQAQALIEGGADGIIIETQTSLEELGLGIEAAREAGSACVVASLAFDVTRDGSEACTMMGIDPEAAAEFMAGAGVDIAGLNCGTGIDMDWAARIVRRYRKVVNLPVMAQPNAGTPELVDMQVVYRETPEEMGIGLEALLDAGAGIVGGCCGSAPPHIAFLRAKMDRISRQEAG